MAMSAAATKAIRRWIRRDFTENIMNRAPPLASSRRTTLGTVPKVVRIVRWSLPVEHGVVEYDFAAVSYTHLTLPTNREV